MNRATRTSTRAAATRGVERRSRGRAAGIGACALAVVLLGACGSDEGAAAPAGTESTGAASSPAPETEPVATQPLDTEPVATEQAATEPAVTEPAATEPAATEPVATEPPPTEPAAPSDPLDDLDQDGAVDEVCGTADLGAGLVVETLCNEYLIPTPEEGVVPTPQSVLLLPSPGWSDLDDVDATVRVAKTTDGHRVAIYVLGSDALFDSGSPTLRSTAQPPLAAVVASIQSRFPGASIVVRGAADSVGDPGANQTLSEQRAASVSAELAVLGLDPSTMSAIGLGAGVPAALEAAADGSVSEIGRQVNRRVEIAVIAA